MGAIVFADGVVWDRFRMAMEVVDKDRAAGCSTTATPDQVAAATRMERVTRSSRAAIDRSAHPTTYQRARFARLLCLHDALEAGASSRDLAFGIVFRGHRPLNGTTWKGSGERRHVLRLIADSRRLVAVGYGTHRASTALSNRLLEYP